MSHISTPKEPHEVGGQPNLAGVDVLHPKVAEALRAMPGMERLRLAHEEWALARERLAVFLTERHPEWDASEVRREVARRLLGGSR